MDMPPGVRERMMRGSCYFEGPRREVEQLPSAGAEFIKMEPKGSVFTGEAMAVKCSVAGCTKQSQKGANGMCWGHWREKTGTPKKKSGIKPVSSSTAPPQSPAKPAVPAPVAATPPPAASPENSPQGLNSLIPPVSGYTLDIPQGLLDRMEEAGVWPADVITLIEMLLDGRLRRVA
jgi:hypothetical protein